MTLALPQADLYDAALDEEGFTRTQLEQYACDYHAEQVLEMVSPEAIKDIAHRKAWRYECGSSASGQALYTFNAPCLLDFVRAILAAYSIKKTNKENT